MQYGSFANKKTDKKRVKIFDGIKLDSKIYLTKFSERPAVPRIINIFLDVVKVWKRRQNNVAVSCFKCCMCILTQQSFIFLFSSPVSFC